MSNIYIKGVEFPTRCFDEHGICFAYDSIEHRCNLKKDEMVYFSTRVCGIKPSWCPLIKVTDHGDLIDVDKYEYPGDLADEQVIIPASYE